IPTNLWCPEDGGGAQCRFVLSGNPAGILRPTLPDATWSQVIDVPPDGLQWVQASVSPTAHVGAVVTIVYQRFVGVGGASALAGTGNLLQVLIGCTPESSGAGMTMPAPPPSNITMSTSWPSVDVVPDDLDWDDPAVLPVTVTVPAGRGFGPTEVSLTTPSTAM